jgi:site-specific DNA recombinase
MKAVGYIRLTAEEAVKGQEDCKTQEARIRNYAKNEGLDLTSIYVDDPIGVLQSAPTLGDVCSRAGVINMLDEATAKSWKYVIVVHLNRLTRTDIDFNPIEELTRCGKQVAVVGEKLHIRKSEGRRAKKREVFDQSLSVAERLLKGREAGARAGKHQSGPAPYGYMRDYTERSTKGVRLQIHPDEAAVVRIIFKEYLRRKSMKRLIEHLDEQGLKTRRKKQWSRAGVSWILKNETYLGRVHFGNIRAKGQHPPIISPIIFNKVQKLIRKNNKRGGKDKTEGQATPTSIVAA